MTAPDRTAKLTSALPFALSMLNVPLAWIGAVHGGWSVVLLPLYSYFTFSILDALTGLNLDNPDPNTPDSDLFWYRAITMIWFPIQAITVFSLIYYVTHSDHLSLLEVLVLFYGVGIMAGATGIVFSHELMHQKNKLERWLGDLLLANVLYSHFRSEHLLVHHVDVATPRDAVTARYNEGFPRYFLRVLRQCPRSAWAAEKRMLARRGASMFDRRNPFWRYAALQALMLGLALLAGGWAGLGLFLFLAFVAIWQLELTNYVEHYGLTRKYLGDGKFERVMPHHSWNASHRATNWLLINLQRHSDHHYKPDRRFPLLQTYGADQAPQLPYGYPIMASVAMVPPLWRRWMNPRVRKWRAMYYPEITDWAPYKRGLHTG
ncbi:alkane 1-monooxygenase [Pseudooceanicola sp.]|uniref:alkane 1-monooxygenase n=1 Tax=Pseudooceanicola sp. TaxID=1914328 RepID=UPI002619C54F|nr:alkane 1-monooxygenase [Pseudooceanicola sp.]MDF1855015.1 alkane 1-monooxygenase [Pseudooceanicola sp.]